MLSDAVTQAMLRAMALVVNADGAGRDEETAVLVAVYTQRVGRSVTVESLERALSTGRAETFAWLGTQAAALSEPEKQQILGAAVQVCMADAELQDEELTLLTKLARTLSIPAGELRGIMNGIWRQERQPHG